MQLSPCTSEMYVVYLLLFGPVAQWIEPPLRRYRYGDSAGSPPGSPTIKGKVVGSNPTRAPNPPSLSVLVRASRHNVNVSALTQTIHVGQPGQ